MITDADLARIAQIRGSNDADTTGIIRPNNPVVSGARWTQAVYAYGAPDGDQVLAGLARATAAFTKNKGLGRIPDLGLVPNRFDRRPGGPAELSGSGWRAIVAIDFEGGWYGWYLATLILDLPPALTPPEAATAATTPITLSGEQTVGGIAVVAGQRVLVAGQADAKDNGPYVVSAGAWARAADALAFGYFIQADQPAVPGELTLGKYTRARRFTLNTPDPIVVGTTPLVFA